jgi:hypothetical protein
MAHNSVNIQRGANVPTSLAPWSTGRSTDQIQNKGDEAKPKMLVSYLFRQ